MTDDTPHTNDTPDTPQPYWWFQGDSVMELVQQLIAADPATARLEAHRDGSRLLFRVVPEVGTATHTSNHINDSHLCPPDCQ